MKNFISGILALGSAFAYAAGPTIIEHSTCNIRSQASDLSETDIKRLEDMGFNYIASDSISRFKLSELEGNELEEGALLVSGYPQFYKSHWGKHCFFGTAQLVFSSDIYLLNLRKSGDQALVMSDIKIANLGGVAGGKCLNKKKRQENIKDKLAITFWELPRCVIK